MKQKPSSKPGHSKRPLGKKNFLTTDWHIGDKVILTNGKQYTVVGLDIPRNSLLLHSDEYDADFIADCRIIHKRAKIYK